MSDQFSEEDLRIAKELRLKHDIPERYTTEIAYIVARVRSEARAGMREACAKAMDDELAKLSKEEDGKDEMHPLIAGEVYGWTAAKAKCLSLPDLAADEAIERIKREARLPLTADLAAMVNYRYLLRDVTERLLRYVETVYPRCPEDSERELEAAKERRSLIADAKTILYETGIAALEGKESSQ